MNMPEPGFLLVLMIAFVVVPALFDAVLRVLDLRHFPREVPPQLKEFLDGPALEKSREYHQSHANLTLLESALMCLVTVLVLTGGILGWLDSVLAGAGLQTPWRGLVFFAILGTGTMILEFPFRAYRTFAIEEKAGFNRSTLRIFMMDALKGLVLGGLVGGILLLAFMLLVQALGQGFWIWFLVVALAFSLLMNLFYTRLLLPLFNKLGPLADGELKTAIEEYARKVDFPLDSILVMDGSKRSTKANAFFTGLGRRKRIVLFDTLVESHPVPELVAILAHEVGHWKKGHQSRAFLASSLQMALMLWFLSLVLMFPELSIALGGTSWVLHLNLSAFALLLGPLSGLSGLFFLATSRRHEFQADAFACMTASGPDLARALGRLSRHNLGNPEPHPVWVLFNHTHPPVLDRIRALEEARPVV